ncbi:MAG: SRPBCC domain-containing protein [Bacteroidetes bacterium]|nr:SRPBCC domain-containing protein [Bacteroidota bacterium]MBP6401308.1 SRPBCC domain-containing protein [Bacteroidia bacterium]MBK9524342.1 SRPBCC domain-containing protein [Bacteroidota bacterium]MBK9543587.1 SRPBCC domain-containing protein [Bacteroidota bacterium]MBL0258194.1 SRPBCC domain-containing protein [Bacteroidota bacterium]
MPENLTAEKHKTITIKRTFNLPLSAVWKAWTEPESMKKWWGPKEYTCPDCSIDFRVGGKFLASMQGADGQKIWSTGTYKEIVPLKKIVNTDSFADSTGTIVPASYYKMSGDWGLELLVTTEFEEVDGKTNISLQHAGLPVELSDECMQGWQSSFDKLESNMK